MLLILRGGLSAGLLELQPGADRLRSEIEHREHLVAPEADDASAPGRHGIPGEIGKPHGEARSCLIPALARERRVAPDVGDQESSAGSFV